MRLELFQPGCDISIYDQFIHFNVSKVLKALPWDRLDIEVLMVELEHAGKVFHSSKHLTFIKIPIIILAYYTALLAQVFPGSRRDVHIFLAEQGFDYAGSLLEDDIFIRKELNVPER